MEIGKVPESVLKRSIFKQIHTKRPEVLVGAGVGEDCAAMELAPGEVEEGRAGNPALPR